jgi:hypothetical protein
MAPTVYRDTFVAQPSILQPGTYPAVRALYWNLALNQGARAHTVDMADNCGMQHNSCDGATPSNRVRAYYTNYIGENIAVGQASPIQVMHSWIVDGTTTPAPDGNGDGHRANIMGSGARELGCGYAVGAQTSGLGCYRQPCTYPYWTQDFGSGRSDFRLLPIPSGTHLFLGSRKSSLAHKTVFMANYYDSTGAAPTSPTLSLNGTDYAMTLYMGAAGKGTYVYIADSATSCRSYFFTFGKGGATYRFPETGVLMTYGEGSCASDYSASSVRDGFVRPGAGHGTSPRVSHMGSVLRIEADRPGDLPTLTRIVGLGGRTFEELRWSIQAGSGTAESILQHPLARGTYLLVHEAADGTRMPSGALGVVE